MHILGQKLQQELQKNDLMCANVSLSWRSEAELCSGSNGAAAISMGGGRGAKKFARDVDAAIKARARHSRRT